MNRRFLLLSKLFIKGLLSIVMFSLCACSFLEQPPDTPSPKEAPLQSQSPSPKASATPSPLGQTSSAATIIYDNFPERNQNLKLAIRAVDQTLLQQGEEFSFNQIVGDRTEEKGYQKAVGYDEHGEKQQTVGGGICQISSTIHMAALNGGFEITERHSHSHEVPYADSNHDATVSYGGYDFRFVNNRDKPVIISASITENKVFVTIEELIS